MKIHEKTLYVQGFPINRGIKSRLENSRRFPIVDKKNDKEYISKIKFECHMSFPICGLLSKCNGLVYTALLMCLMFI